MIKLYDSGVFLVNGSIIVPDDENLSINFIKLSQQVPDREAAKKNTISYPILQSHNTSNNPEKLKIRFDAMASHDITYVGVVQTAKASGLTEFPMPYVLTNCHNSLCAVGGTLNEDDHLFGLSAAKKYGGIYVPAHLAVIHQYMREMHAFCGGMILGSDSHTRYGALGAMSVGEGGGELVKQLLGRTYDVSYPGVIGIYLTGKPRHGVGSQDVALAIIGAVFEKGYVKNKVMEFIGDGVGSLSIDFRNGIDVMTTETTCLTSIWKTDVHTKEYFKTHGREREFCELAPGMVAYYDGMVYIDLSTIKPMIALPFHPSNVYEIDTFNENLADILHETEQHANSLFEKSSFKYSLTDKIINGKLKVDQGIIAGCAGGTYENIMLSANMAEGSSFGNGAFALSVYPSSQPVMLALMKQGALEKLMTSGATVRTAFCGPCFGAGDVPAHNSLSIRHTTRNFPNREGSKPNNGQIASVALMDARSITATALNGGILTSAEECEYSDGCPQYSFESTVYRNRVYNGFKKSHRQVQLQYGPNIVDWPEISGMQDDLLLHIAAFITDPVTTTDELIPSGDTSTFRSNPIGLAEFTLSKKDPAYVGVAKKTRQLESEREKGNDPALLDAEMAKISGQIQSIQETSEVVWSKVKLGSAVYAVKPGDGSAREQAASCQRVLGGCANIAGEYATKRYRSNLINWGIVPLLLEGKPEFKYKDYIYIPGIKKALQSADTRIKAYILGETAKEIILGIGEMTADEREILLAGCLINYYKDNCYKTN